MLVEVGFVSGFFEEFSVGFVAGILLRDLEDIVMRRDFGKVFKYVKDINVISFFY